MAVGDSMELVHKGRDISEVEIKELCSWCHLCAEHQEMAWCGKEKEGKENGYRKTLLEISKEGVDGAHSFFISFIIRHLLSTVWHCECSDV